MRILTWLSLGYAAVLVTALAVALLSILIYLLRIRSAVRSIALALGDAADRTAPVPAPMKRLEESAAHVQAGVARACEGILRAGRSVGIDAPQSPPAQAGAVARWQEPA